MTGDSDDEYVDHVDQQNIRTSNEEHPGFKTIVPNKEGLEKSLNSEQGKRLDEAEAPNRRSLRT